MTDNPILDELYLARKQLLAMEGNNLFQLVTAIQKREEHSEHRVVSSPINERHEKFKAMACDLY